MVVFHPFVGCLHSFYVFLLLQMAKIGHGVLGAIHVVFAAFSKVVAATGAICCHNFFSLRFSIRYAAILQVWIKTKTYVLAMQSNIHSYILFENRMPFYGLLLRNYLLVVRLLLKTFARIDHKILVLSIIDGRAFALNVFFSELINRRRR